MDSPRNRQYTARSATRKTASRGQYKCRGILLHSIKYSERKLIVYLLTAEWGRRSFITTVGSGGRGLMQPLFILEFEAWAGRGELHNMESPTAGHSLREIPFDVIKSTISLFLSELLYRLIREGEADPRLYLFVERSIIDLDGMDSGEGGGTANFHLWFLVQLTRYMGYMPQDNFTEGWMLDYRNGFYTPTNPTHTLCMPPHEATLFHSLMHAEIGALADIPLGRAQRVSMLEKLTDLYGYHTDAIYQVNSLRILAEIF